MFVVQHGNNEVDIVITDDLKTDKYENIQKIFVCDNAEEAAFLVTELNSGRQS